MCTPASSTEAQRLPTRAEGQPQNSKGKGFGKYDRKGKGSHVYEQAQDFAEDAPYGLEGIPEDDGEAEQDTFGRPSWCRTMTATMPGRTWPRPSWTQRAC